MLSVAVLLHPLPKQASQGPCGDAVEGVWAVPVFLQGAREIAGR